MAPMDDLAAALDNHQVTDDQGEVPAETTALEETAPQDQTPVDETATAEKSVDEDNPPKEETKSENDKTEEPDLIETAADETGKRYVPESRFKEVYAKWKDAERKAEIGTRIPQGADLNQQPVALKPSDKADALEIELLRSTLPQFNPESSDYSREVDELGYSLYEGSKDKKGNYTMTRIEAGRRALSMAKKITSKIAEIKTEARTVKAQQSDQGITNRVLTRETTKVDPNKMTLEEKEAWLKENNMW